MMDRFETYFDAFYAYFYHRNSPILKILGQFENLGFVIVSTRENIRLIARTPFEAEFRVISYTSHTFVFWPDSTFSRGFELQKVFFIDDQTFPVIQNNNLKYKMQQNIFRAKNGSYTLILSICS